MSKIKVTIWTDGLRGSEVKTYNTNGEDLLTPVSEQYNLDESLDNASITLAFIDRKEPFKPFTFVKLDNDDPTTTGVLDDAEFWLVQNDQVTEYPTLGKFTHKILLVETTKYLERFMVGTKTVTQPLVADYSKMPTRSAERFISKWTITDEQFVPGAKDALEDCYTTPISTDKTLTLKSFRTVFKIEDVDNEFERTELTNMDCSVYVGSTRIGRFTPNDAMGAESSNLDKTATLSSSTLSSYLKDPIQTIKIVYKAHKHYVSSTPLGGGTSEIKGDMEAGYIIDVYNPNVSSPTIYLNNVIDDLLAVAEPIAKGDTPRFVCPDVTFNGKKLSEIISPEYTFTDASLYEALATIGSELHAVPRLNVSVSNNVPTFKISFTPFCSNQNADLSYFHKVNGQTAIRDMEQYSDGLDTYAEGIVPSYSTLSNTGQVGAPGFEIPKTLRAEDGEFRITEATGIISTDFPIERIVSLRVAYDSTFYDITPYVYEQAEYVALSSYTKTFPASKQYALYYVHGERNIRGLSFERENTLSQVFEDPAIVAIYKKVTGESISKIWGAPANHTKLQFKIKYIPVTSMKIRQRRAYLFENDTATLLSYNQGANKIDSSEYGTHLAGTLARLGVPQYTQLYVCNRLYARTDARKLVGCRLPNGNVITSVAVEYLSDYAKVMITSTTEFNRISQYIGIKSQLRQYEISEKLAQDRNVVFEDYLVISSSKPLSEQISGTSMITSKTLSDLRAVLCFVENHRVDIAFLWGKSDGGTDLAKIILPVISFGAGRSMVFNMQYLDNYGAGYGTIGATVGSTNYRVQENIRYTDAYGRMESLRIGLFSSSTLTNHLAKSFASFPAVTPNTNYALTESTMSSAARFTLGSKGILIRKDNRERLGITYQVNVVQSSGYILSPKIGELLGFCTSSRDYYFTSSTTNTIKPYDTVYVGDAGTLSLGSALTAAVTGTPSYLELKPNTSDGTWKGKFTKNVKSWAIVTSGNQLVFGKNETKDKGASLPTIYFYGMHKIDRN